MECINRYPNPDKESREPGDLGTNYGTRENTLLPPFSFIPVDPLVLLPETLITSSYTNGKEGTLVKKSGELFK